VTLLCSNARFDKSIYCSFVSGTVTAGRCRKTSGGTLMLLSEHNISVKHESKSTVSFSLIGGNMYLLPTRTSLFKAA
jgi:hypothetical protein